MKQLVVNGWNFIFDADISPLRNIPDVATRHYVLELLSNLVFEVFGSCGDLVWVCGFNSVFECDACDDFGEVVKSA